MVEMPFFYGEDRGQDDREDRGESNYFKFVLGQLEDVEAECMSRSIRKPKA